VRFDSARAAGLTEEKAGRIRDGYAAVLSPRETAALELTDAIIGRPQSLSEETKRRLAAHFSEPEIVEIALGVGLFLGMSKVLINLGLEPEPEAMPVTVLPTPGS
jgi:alkylhydroperoxidase family enzyme